MRKFDWVWLADKLQLSWSEKTLEVFQDNAERLKLDNARGFTLELKARLVLRDGRMLASFDEIERFVIEVRGQREAGERYRLILGRVGKYDIVIGATLDQLACSRLAAHMGRLTGKPVEIRRLTV